MEVQATNNRTPLKSIATTAVLGGAIAASIENSRFPNTVKAAVKNSKLTQDQFIAKAEECAIKTMEQTGKKFDLEVIKQNAAELYPGMKKLGDKASKTIKIQLGKAFICTAAVCAGVGLLSNALLNKKIEKDLK